MEGAGRGDELVQLGSGASYQATRSAVWAFPLIAGEEDRVPEDAQSQEYKKKRGKKK